MQPLFNASATTVAPLKVRIFLSGTIPGGYDVTVHVDIVLPRADKEAKPTLTFPIRTPFGETAADALVAVTWEENNWVVRVDDERVAQFVPDGAGYVDALEVAAGES